MAKLAKQEVAAFDVLYARYSGRMLRYFLRMLNRDQERAEDLLQDLFLRLVEKPHLFDPQRRFSTWLYTIAANLVKNEYRRRSVRQVVTRAPDLSQLGIGEAPDDERLDRDQFGQSLIQALDGLSEAQREVFVLRYQEDLPLKEISEILGCAEGTVKSRLFYAQRNLAGKLEAFNPKNC